MTVTSYIHVRTSKSSRENPYRRLGIYTLILTIFAGIAFYTNLGGPTLYADEAQYALCVQHAHQSGNWLTFSPYPPEPYFQKPPMYFWLTGLTYRFFGDGLLRFRFWSALFGVGCVALTCCLGAILLSPECGLLSGLLLLTNHYFQVDHGARTGSMDTAVTFGAVLMFILYWWLRERRIGWWGWITMGLVAGLTSLFKPLAALPVLFVIGLHAIVLDQKLEGVKRPIRGIVIASLVCVVVIVPYFFAVWEKAGTRVFTEMFEQEIVLAATVGDPGTHEHMFRDAGDDPIAASKFAGQPWYTLINRLHSTSTPFALAGVGIAFVVIASWQGKNRGEFSLLGAAAILYLLLFSLSVVKRIRLIYPAFPEISIAIAASWIAAIAWIFRRFGRELTTTSFTGPFATICVLLMIFQSISIGRDQMSPVQTHFGPYNAYHELEPALNDQRARVIFYGFPSAQFQWRKVMGLDAAECYYLEQMSNALHVNDPVQLKSLLADGKPTLLLESSFDDLPPLNEDTTLSSRSDRRFAYQHRAFQLRGIDMGSLLQQHLSVASPSNYLQLLAGDGRPLAKSQTGFEISQRFLVRVLPPLRDNCWLTLSLAKPAEAPDLSARYHSTLAGELLDWGELGRLSHGPRIALKLDRGRWAKSGTTDIEIELWDARGDRPTTPLRAEVTNAQLDVCPDPIEEK